MSARCLKDARSCVTSLSKKSGSSSVGSYTRQRKYALLLEATAALDDLVCHEILARPIGLHDGLDQLLRDVLVVGQKLLGVLGQAVAAVAKGGVVVVVADTGVQAHGADDALSVDVARLGVGVELVEVRHAQGKVRIGEELDRLRLG